MTHCKPVFLPCQVASISALAALQSLVAASPASALEFLIFTEDEIWTAIAFVVVFGGYLLAVPVRSTVPFRWNTSPLTHRLSGWVAGSR